MVVALLALIAASAWTVSETLSLASAEAETLVSCCEVPIEIVEGDRVRVGCRGEPVLADCGELAPGDRVRLGAQCAVEPGGMSAGLRLLQGLGLDLNRVSAADLELLEGIGPTKARAIIEHRAAHGRFGSVDDLLQVDGIGPKTLERLRRDLRVTP